jgi:plasmid stabilization system protein ParE
MAYRVIFRQGARDEAIAAAAYIAEHGSSEIAARWYAELEAAVASLAQYPSRCELAREHAAFPGLDLRQLVFKSHRMIFSAQGAEVHVLCVRHVAQDDVEAV